MDWHGSHTGPPRGVNHSQGPKSSIAANNNPIQPSELDFTSYRTYWFWHFWREASEFFLSRTALESKLLGNYCRRRWQEWKACLIPKKKQLKNFIDYQNLSHHSDPNLLNMSKMWFSFLQIYHTCTLFIQAVDISKSFHNFDMYKLGSDQNFQEQSFYNLSRNSKRNQLNVI